MTPQELTSRLLSIWLDDEVNRCFQVLNLSESQRDRYAFSTFLFTLTLPTMLAFTRGRTDLGTFISTAFTLMLNAWKSTDSFVRVGDFVITEDENVRLVEHLEKRFQQRVSVENIQNHKIQMGFLLGATADIRGEQQIEDLIEILASSPPDKQLLNLICKFGIRLESYIYEDFCPERTLTGGLSRSVTFGRLAEQYFKRINAAFEML